MLIVLSDLHFSETQSYKLGNIAVNHNLPPSVYRSYFDEIAEITRSNHIKKVDLVLAGDIFEINRNTLWLQDELRPYIDCKDVKPHGRFEKILVEIMLSICKDPYVAETLDQFRNLENRIQVPVNLHYLPGNHDRLLNSSLLVRHLTQLQLGLPELEQPFENQFILRTQNEDLVLVRHGHEYDPANFNTSFKMVKTIPTFIDPQEYGKPVLGDVITCEFAAKLPWIFREYYSDDNIRTMPDLALMYRRLIEFDNVRPANALMNFLFSTPGLSKPEVWKFIEPVFIRLMNEFAEIENIEVYLKKFSGVNRFFAQLFHPILKLKPWKWGVPYWLGRSMVLPVSRKSQLNSPLEMVIKEESLISGRSSVQCIVSGHTHNPLVELLEVEGDHEKYYINSGTFRNVITSTPEMNEFGRIRSKARVLVFEPGERNPEYYRPTGWSFDFIAKYGFGSELDS
ncbi:MAG: metallophosphoesterase [Anaerolineaceae bacterium]|nr:metallophosphoesterase [Anaerolineaceae bacterium]